MTRLFILIIHPRYISGSMSHHSCLTVDENSGVTACLCKRQLNTACFNDIMSGNKKEISRFEPLHNSFHSQSANSEV